MVVSMSYFRQLLLTGGCLTRSSEVRMRRYVLERRFLAHLAVSP